MAMNTLQQAAHDGVVELIKVRSTETRQAALIGYAGTGKTYTVNQIRATCDDLGLVVLTVAPTNKAVRVLGQGITVHKALGLAVDSQGRERQTSAGPQLEGVDLLVVDEASMISRRMRDKIMEAARRAGVRCVLWVGDDAQLPPVEDDGQVSPALRCQTQWRLTKIMRGDPDECGASLVGAAIRQALEEGRQVTIYDLIELGPLPGVEFCPHGQPPAWVDPRAAGMSTPAQILVTALANGLDARAASYTNEATTMLADEVRRYFTGNDLPTVGETLSFNKPFLEFDGGVERVVYSTDEEVVVSSVSELRTGSVTGCEFVTVTLDGANRKLRIPRVASEWLKCVQDVRRHRDVAQAQGDRMLLDQCREWLQELTSMTDLRSVYSSTVHKLQGSTVDLCVVDMHNIQRCIRGGDWETFNRMLYVAVTRPRTFLSVVF